MGCANSMGHAVPEPEKNYQRSPVGKLKVHFYSIRLLQETNPSLKMQTKLKLKMGN